MNRLFVFLIALFPIHVLSAQHGQSYVNINYTIGNYQGTTISSSQQVKHTGRNFPIGLQQVIQKSRWNAWRIGVTFLKQQVSGDYKSSQNNSEFVEEYKLYSVFSPSFQIGHELQWKWYKQNQWYAGVECAAGMMHNYYKLVSNRYQPGRLESRSTMDGFHWNTHGSASLLSGVRIHVGACILGYEICLTNRYTAILGAQIQQTEPWFLQHRISLGYIRGYKKEQESSYSCWY